jgi:Na+-transporting NADH:ubiquinone oxidoreductase subunit C
MSVRKPPESNLGISLFVTALCLACALVLSVMASVLQGPIERSDALNYIKQLLITAKVLNANGYFEIQQGGALVPAVWDADQGTLVQSTNQVKATPEQLNEVYNARIRAYLVDAQGQIKTFEQAGIDQASYITDNKVTGYADLDEKLFYAVLPNYSTVDNPTGKGETPAAYIFPVAGFGLWGPIYGYISLEPDGNTVLATTWVAPYETPGLGAEIQYPAWQKDFYGKVVFHESPDGSTNFDTAPIGITVVKGKVSDVYGDSYQAKSAVDGVSGATLTGDGVTSAYSDSLSPYRSFLLEVQKASSSGKNLFEGVSS